MINQNIIGGFFSPKESLINPISSLTRHIAGKTDSSYNEEKKTINYNIILNADVPGVISSGQKDAIIRELRNLGIAARIVSTRDTSIPIEPDVSFENYSYFDIYLEAYGDNKVAVK